MTSQTYHSTRFTSRFAVLGEENRQNGTLVLIHGLYENLTIWEEFAKPLAASHQVLLLDTLGHNPEAPLKEGATFTMREMADEVFAIMQHCGIRDAVLVGHSMGGAVAMQCLKHYPELVRGLCLFHATPFADPEEVRKSREATIESIRKGGKEMAVEGLLKRVLPEKAFVESKEMVNKLHAILHQVPESGMIAAHGAMAAREDTSELLINTTAPVLTILGKLDPIIPTLRMLPLATAPQKALVCLLEGVAHTGMLEAPKECRAAVEGLLAMAF